MTVTATFTTFDEKDNVAAERKDIHRVETPSCDGGRTRDQFVANHLHDVRAIAFRYRGLGLSVDDLVQEGALGLLEAIERCDPRRGMDVDRYARYRVRRALRNAFTQADGSTLEALIAEASAIDPLAEAVEHEEAQQVDDAVAALPARQREVVSRHFGIGRDPEEISDVAADLHVSQQRARAIERDALYALRDRLEPTITLRPTR